jgi:hypothetical protein
MKEMASSALAERSARRVRGLCTTREPSLAEPAGPCGVSRSMISLIERDETAPWR